MTDTDQHDDADDAATGEQTRGPGDSGEPADGANADVTATAPTAGDADRSPDGGTADSAASGGTDAPQTGEGSSDERRSAGSRLAWLVQVATLVILCLLALVATFRFYFAASEAIRVWISADFVSVFQAAFNLLIVIVCAYGVSVLVRRLG